MELEVEFSDSSTEGEGEVDVSIHYEPPEQVSPDAVPQQRRGNCSRSGRIRKMRYSSFSNIDNESEFSEDASSDLDPLTKKPRARQLANRSKSKDKTQKGEDLDYISDEEFEEAEDDEDYIGEEFNSGSVDAKRSTDSDDIEELYCEPTRKKRGRKPSKNKQTQATASKRVARSSRKTVNYLKYEDSISLDSLTQESDDGEIDSGSFNGNINSNDTSTVNGSDALISDQQYIRTIDRVLSSRQNPDDPSLTEYKIKWMGYSHLHNTWESSDSLIKEGVLGLRRLENFQKKMADILYRRKFMTEDEIEQEDITFEIQRQLDLDALVPERIVDAYREGVGPGAGLNGSEDRTQLYYFVKWLSCPYDQCTWESYETMEEHNFLSYIDSFHSQMNLVSKFDRNSDYSMRSLALTSFEPYLSTPFYMGARVEEMAKLEEGNPMDKVKMDGEEGFKKGQSTLKSEKDAEDCFEKDSKPEQIKMELETEDPPSSHLPTNYDTERESKNSTDKNPEKTENLSDEPFQPRTLRDYQIYGLNWMISRFKKNVNILLADEMGLGKTVQTISVVGHCLYMEKIVAPFLVVVPQSTSDNWLREFKKWLPDANVVLYHGNAYARELIRTYELSMIEMKDEEFGIGRSDRKSFQEKTHSDLSSGNGTNTCNTTGGSRVRAKQKKMRYKFDVVITTPSILNSQVDCDFLRQIDWYMMIVDEAHQLKNRDSKRFKELHDFATMYRLLLSGTPLHNNLEELWSLLHFINPDKFLSYSEFRLRYPDIENPNVIGPGKQQQLEELQNELQEYVLRRVKKDVEKSLPNKVERILRVELSPQQTDMYKSILTRNYDELSKTTGGTKTSLQNICMELKKVCNHPFLIHRPELDPSQGITLASIQHQLIYGCGKLCLLDKLLSRLKEKGSRVLIFSQMVRMLNIISEFLVLRGFRHQRLDGTMGKELRKKAMDHFNSANSDDFCFLLSTKAGGLGINLTTADTVIIYDSDWNPQNDLQAEARAHRIGQKKQVQIYRLVTKDSIEENILERAKTKMVLDTLVVQGLNNLSSSNSQSQISSSAAASVVALASQALYPNGKKPGSGGGGGASFSRDELAKILKFGAQKLWNKETKNNGSFTNAKGGACKSCTTETCNGSCMHVGSMHVGDGEAPTSEESGLVLEAIGEEERNFASQIDLDKVLADAEEHVHDTQGLADGLLRSFANIADFRYEAPPLIIDSNTGALLPLNGEKGSLGCKEDVDFDSKEFWEKTIPEEERLKLVEQSSRDVIVTGPRKSAMRDGSLKYRDDGYTFVGEDSDSDDGRSGKKGNSGAERGEASGSKGKKQSKKKGTKKSAGAVQGKNKEGTSDYNADKKVDTAQTGKTESSSNLQKDMESSQEVLNTDPKPNREEYPLPDQFPLDSREDFEQVMSEITGFQYKYCELDEQFPTEICQVYKDISNGIKQAKSGKRAKRDSRVLHPKRRFKLFRSILKFGDPYRRLKDIILDSRLKGKVDANTVLNESQMIITLCFEKAQKELTTDNPSSAANSRDDSEIDQNKNSLEKAPGEDWGHPKDEDTQNTCNTENASVLEGQSTADTTSAAGAHPESAIEDFADDNDMEITNQTSKIAKKNSLLIGNHRANICELIDRIKMLSSLDKLMRDCNPGVAQPWKLPTGPLPRPDTETVKGDEENEDEVDDDELEEEEEEEKEKVPETLVNPEPESKEERESSSSFENCIPIDGKNYLKFELPPILIKSLRTPSWGVPWTLQTDIDILKGIYVYGFSNWTVMSLDENLSLSCIKKIKFDKLKQRTLRVMKHLHSVMVIGKTARKKRKFNPPFASDQESMEASKGESLQCKRGKRAAPRRFEDRLDGGSSNDAFLNSSQGPRPLVVGGRKGLPEFVVECTNIDEKDLKKQARTCFNHSNVKPQLLEIKKLFHPSNNMADTDVVANLKVLLPVVGDEITEILKLASNDATRKKVHNCLWSYVAKCTVFQPQDIEKIYLSWKGISPVENQSQDQGGAIPTYRENCSSANPGTEKDQVSTSPN
ncbi:Chromodomain-helicase-DNA-binding protein 2 [Cryptosporidium felis]|nr:Chromodomain-helicase-DNA-binding protein 2 [Cryptosporidium felis]